MNITITGRHQMEITDALHQHAIVKLKNLNHYDESINAIDIILEVNKLQRIAEASIPNSQSGRIHATAEALDMYDAIDQLVEKLKRQIKEHKAKKYDKHHRSEAKKIKLREIVE
ncbi:MAG: ribosome hibernation-promoting factor, HPF/YfiA family [Gammaproteobacteria bacterium]